MKTIEEDNRIQQEEISMYWCNLSKDKYGIQQFLTDPHFDSVTVQIDPDTADLYNIESGHYSFSRIQYQQSSSTGFWESMATLKWGTRY